MTDYRKKLEELAEYAEKSVTGLEEVIREIRECKRRGIQIASFEGELAAYSDMAERIRNILGKSEKQNP